MKDYDKLLEQEKEYLNEVNEFLRKEIERNLQLTKKQKEAVIDIRKEMWDSGVQLTDDPESMIEYNQYLTAERIETSQYTHKAKELQKYINMQDKPYFARFDFTEEGEDEAEKIYIGYNSLFDDATYDMLVYDWRAPAASVFYRYELGPAGYTAPFGEIKGEVTLKRQYEIKKAQLDYFFDCGVAINDQILKDALGKNASTHMKNIVETIQKEQDQIIRNKENDLLIVQGVAGSGKTSIAMHRIAYLLYQELENNLNHNQIIIISPNNLFGEYISTVLPELGEENVRNKTLEDIFDEHLNLSANIWTRMRQVEYMMTSPKREEVREQISFKGSKTFTKILDRLVKQYESRLIKFADVYYDGELIQKKEVLEKEFRHNPLNFCIMRRLNRIENTLLNKIKSLEKARVKELANELEDHEVQSYIDKARNQFTADIMKFTKVDYLKLYKRMLKDKGLLKQLIAGLKTPGNLEKMLKESHEQILLGQVRYEDAMAILYLKLKIDDKLIYKGIKQVLVDEAQDYYYIQYKILGMLFKGARYTVIGDVNQTIEKQENETLYDAIIEILEPKNSLKLSLTKSYRSAHGINMFAAKLREDADVLEAFEREELPPRINGFKNKLELNNGLIEQIKSYQEDGFETVTVLCKTMKEAREVYTVLSDQIEAQLVKEEDTKIDKGVLIMPIYIAKGLEYDAVIIYDASQINYNHKEDKQLLYIACTRALHRLSINYETEISEFLVPCLEG